MIFNQETSSLILSLLLRLQRLPRRCPPQGRNQILLITEALQYGTNTLSRLIYPLLHELQQRGTLGNRTRLHLPSHPRLILKGKLRLTGRWIAASTTIPTT